MNFLTKSSLAVAVLAGASLSGAVQAQGLNVTEVTSGTGDYLYTYNVTPVADTSSLSFSFFDPSVKYVSETGPLTQELNFAPGNFLVYTFSGPTLTAGSTEIVNFSSPDAPGSFVNIDSNTPAVPGGNGRSTSAGPAAVPEASTTISFGLLLMLGLGGVVLAARKKSAQASA